MVKFLQAKVFHKRIYPHNVFCYKAGYISIPLIGNTYKPWFFSFNKWNIFSFYNKDHAQRNGESALEWACEKLSKIGIESDNISQVVLITHPRCFGFVFNPVSFYFCLNKKGKPFVVIAEVNNTFSQTHSYIIHEHNFTPILSNKIYKAEKEFFVSPFFTMEGNYEFRFIYSQNKISVFINYFKDEKLIFETSLIGKIVQFTAKNALPYVFTTFKTAILIGFQAFKLKFVKKLKFRKPKKQSNKKILV
jgi:DUF1365 family protein